MPEPPIPPDVFAQVSHAWALQDYALGEALLAQACRKHPDHFHLRTCHAAALGYCARFKEARSAFDRLIAECPPAKESILHGLLGIEWCRIGRHDLAVPLLETALQKPDPAAPLFEALADAHDHLGRQEAALAAAHAGLRRHPGHPGILLVQSRLLRRGGDPEQAERVARGALGHPQGTLETKVRAGHELGHALDAQNRFEEAFAAFMAAKARRRDTLAPFLDLWRRRHTGFDRPALWPVRLDLTRLLDDSAWQDVRPCRLALLVGAPRSGTTLLERVLDAHDGIVSASERPVAEQLWRGLDDLKTVAKDTLMARRRDYLNRMEDALEEPVGDRLLLDKNPSRLRHAPAFCRFFPETKVIMALRDPRAVAWSNFIQFFPDNPDTAACNGLDTLVAHLALQWRFWLHLRREFPGPWHESRYEDTVADLRQSTRSTLAFLGLDWQENQAQFHARARPASSPSYAEVRQPVHLRAVDHWRHYEPFLGDAFKPLDEVAQAFGYA